MAAGIGISPLVQYDYPELFTPYPESWDEKQREKAQDVWARINEMRAFHDKILEAWDYSQAGGKGSKNPIIRGRKLYRLVRETIEQEAALAPKGGK